MIELVYTSSACESIKAEDIKNISNTSQAFNTENLISGCLFYHNNQFVQILEGDKNVVTDLYMKIAKDKRHFDFLLLTKGEIEERVFPNWSMVFYDINDNNDNKLNSFSKQNFEDNMMAFSELAKKPTEAVHVFWSFVERIMEKD